MGGPDNILLSVVLCAHNPREHYLSDVLRALRMQSLAADRWELILVDNASATPLANKFSAPLHPNYRCVLEPRLGLTHARLRGINEARADVIVFVDDDNILDTQYLETVLRLAREHPRLGVWGGRVELQFDETPPDWTRPYWPFLAYRPVERDEICQRHELCEPLPVGAGLCVRREVAVCYSRLAAASPLRLALDRCGPTLTSGGDTDLALTACALDWQRGVFTALGLRHRIPFERLTEEYLARLVAGIQLSCRILESIHPPHVPPPEITLWWRIRYWCALTTKFGRKRRFFRSVKKAQCEARQLYDRLQFAQSTNVALNSSKPG